MTLQKRQKKCSLQQNAGELSCTGGSIMIKLIVPRLYGASLNGQQITATCHLELKTFWELQLCMQRSRDQQSHRSNASLTFL